MEKNLLTPWAEGNLPTKLLFGQRAKLPDNVSGYKFTLQASTTQAAPERFSLTLYGSTLKSVFLHTAGAAVFVKITDGQNMIFPVNGFLGLPAVAIGPVSLERELIGPPWQLDIYAYNTEATPQSLTVIAVAGDRRELDTDYLILQQLQEINRKLS